MSMIRVSDLTFRYDGAADELFEHASFAIDTDWKLGFVGRNGRGKTTLLKLLCGEYAYTGRIAHSTSFAYFPFALADESDTGEAVFASVSGAPTWRLLREANLLDLKRDALLRPFSTLSPGEQTKVLLAALFCRDDHFLLIDEPTNHLDMEGRAAVSRYLASKKGFVLVSHDRAFLDGCVDHILSINRANIEVQAGNFSSWEENRRRQDAFELTQNERLAREVSALREAAKRTAGWADAVERGKIGSHAGDRGYIGARSAAMMKRAKSIETRRETAAEEKSRLLKNVERNETLRISPLPHHADLLVEMRSLSVDYGQGALFEPLNFALRQGQRVALAGANGSGKSSVVKLIMGQDVPHTGVVRTASGLIVSYMPQDTSFLNGLALPYARQNGLDETLFLTILRKLDFPREQFDIDMRAYSAGQKKKVLLAATLAQRAHLYLWDEPLNYVDVLSRMQIRDLLLACRPTMLFVEHDRAFVSEVATDTVPLC